MRIHVTSQRTPLIRCPSGIGIMDDMPSVSATQQQRIHYPLVQDPGFVSAFLSSKRSAYSARDYSCTPVSTVVFVLIPTTFLLLWSRIISSIETFLRATLNGDLPKSDGPVLVVRTIFELDHSLSNVTSDETKGKFIWRRILLLLHQLDNTIHRVKIWIQVIK